MATLTDAAILSKKAFIWTLIAIAAALILFLLYGLGKTFKNSLFPSKPPPATVAFGKLPTFDLSEGVKIPGGVKYRVETISGDMPNLDAMAKVFEIKGPESSFGDLDNAVKKAAALDFESKPVEVSQGKAKFANSRDASRSLTIETATGNFVLQSDYLNNPEIIATRPKKIDDAKESAIEFFRTVNLPNELFSLSKITYKNYKIDGGQLAEVLSLSSANLLKVIFGRADLDKLPLLSINIENPTVWALASDRKIVGAELSIANIQKHKFSTYPLKGAKKAFEELQSGKGTLNRQLKGNEFVIRTVSLGYVETHKYQPYLQPVYIFSGDEGLLAYVTAVDSNWIKPSSPSGN